MRIKQKFKKCKLQITKHAFKRFVEKNFPITKLRKMIFKSRWFPYIEPEKITCICKENTDYWTIIIAPTSTYIFIITVFPSNNREKEQFRKDKEINSFELTDNGG